MSLRSPTSDPSPFRSSLGLMFSLFQRNAHVPFNLISPAGWWAFWWSSFEKVILVSLEWESMWWHADYMSEPFQAPFGYFITDGGIGRWSLCLISSFLILSMKLTPRITRRHLISKVSNWRLSAWRNCPGLCSIDGDRNLGRISALYRFSLWATLWYPGWSI